LLRDSIEQSFSGEDEKCGINMSEIPKNASHGGRPTPLASGNENRAAQFAAQADSMLAHYPTYERQQIIELLHILASKPGEAEDGVRVAGRPLW
jgi:hypothetical protein